MISTKGPAAVVTVSGLLLTWTRIDVQCTGRNQSALEVWTAVGPAKAPGSVTATFGTAVDEGSALAVARYGGVRSFGGSKRKNTNGGDGACIDGSDSGDFNFSVSTKGASGAVAFVGIALRGRMLSPASMGPALRWAVRSIPRSTGR